MVCRNYVMGCYGVTSFDVTGAKPNRFGAWEVHQHLSVFCLLLMFMILGVGK